MMVEWGVYFNFKIMKKYKQNLFSAKIKSSLMLLLFSLVIFSNAYSEIGETLTEGPSARFFGWEEISYSDCGYNSGNGNCYCTSTRNYYALWIIINSESNRVAVDCP
jgi:hypothetical protein